MSVITPGKVNINMLNMIYDRVTHIGNNVYFCVTDSTSVLVDEYGNDIKLYDEADREIKVTGIDKLEISKDIIPLCGKCTEVSEDELAIIFNTREKRYIIVKDTYTIERATDNILAIKDTVKDKWKINAKLINSKFEIIAEFKDVESFNRFDEYPSNKPGTAYLYYTLNGSRHRFTIDKTTDRIISYDNYKLNCNKTSNIQLEAVATRIRHKKKFEPSINKISAHSYEGFLYRLSNNGTLIGKEYDEIRKPEQLELSQLVYIYENEYIGIMDEKNGEELVCPEYRKLEYLGFNNFIATNKEGKANILNAYSGNMYADDEIKELITHNTLPIIIIRFNNGTYKFYNIINGIVFNIEDFAKQFSCECNSERPDILRVSLTWGFKYITNTLVPITNLSYIKQLNDSKWIKM